MSGRASSVKEITLTATNRRESLLRALLVLGALVSVPCCRSTGEDSIDGETHFLSTCALEGSSCGPDLRCVCGVCARSCEQTVECTDLNSAATCIPSTESSPFACEARPAAVCDVTCQADADCSTLGPAYGCSGGFCRPDSVLDSSGVGGGSGSPVGTASDGNVTGACTRGDVTGDEVVVLGDVFVSQTHEIPAQLEALARENGALGADESYRDYSSATANTLTISGRLLVDRFAEAQAESPVRVVIMNGGGADMLVRSCPSIPTASCALMVEAVDRAEQLLARMAADGVEDVVWFYYPGPGDTDLAAELEVLRPLLIDVCAQSSVACHWVELKPTFEGHYDEYMQGDFIPSTRGAEVAAAVIWATMQQACIAQ